MNCTHCGKELMEGVTVCDGCGNPVMVSKPLPKIKTENTLTGVVGALIGAILGGASIVLLSQMGYVAAISGLILAVCTLKGYELLGGKLSTKGIIVSILFMVIVPAVAYFLSLGLSLTKEFPEMTLNDSFQLITALLPEDADVQGAVLKDLLMIYGFTALGAFGIVKNAFKKK